MKFLSSTLTSSVFRMFGRWAFALTYAKKITWFSRV
jgi:hypothetical protein